MEVTPAYSEVMTKTSWLGCLFVATLAVGGISACGGDPEPRDNGAGGSITIDRIGGGVASDSAIEVFVDGPMAYTPNTEMQSLAEESGTTPEVYQIVVTNLTEQPIDGSKFDVTATSGGEKANVFTDSAQNIGPLKGQVLKGNTVEYRVGFLVKDPKSVVVRWVDSPNPGHFEVIFGDIANQNVSGAGHS